MSTSDVCFVCLTWLYELFVGTLISLTSAYTGCGRPILNFIERSFDLHGSLRSDSEATSRPGATYMYVQNVDQFSMNMNLKMFCILCLILSCLIILCIILCDTSKASENLTFVLKQSLILSSVFVVIIICCLGAMKIKDSVEQITLDLFQNCDVPEKVSVSLIQR